MKMVVVWQHEKRGKKNPLVVSSCHRCSFCPARILQPCSAGPRGWVMGCWQRRPHVYPGTPRLVPLVPEAGGKHPAEALHLDLTWNLESVTSLAEENLPSASRPTFWWPDKVLQPFLISPKLLGVCSSRPKLIKVFTFVPNRCIDQEKRSCWMGINNTFRAPEIEGEENCLDFDSAAVI